MRRLLTGAAAAVALSACALKGDVRRVEEQVQELRTEMARADTARADFLDATFAQIIALQQLIMDSLRMQRARLARFEGDVRTDMTEVQRQLFQIQELTGQSQARLSEVQRRLQGRQLAAPGGPQADTSGAPAVSSADEIYDVAIQQLRRGSPQTARQAFLMLLSQFPGSELAADAQFHVGESWEGANPDSASAAYAQVVQQFADSPRAPTALYRMGLIAEQQGDTDQARGYYERVVRDYPQSEAAALARTKLNPDR